MRIQRQDRAEQAQSFVSYTLCTAHVSNVTHQLFKGLVCMYADVHISLLEQKAQNHICGLTYCRPPGSVAFCQDKDGEQ